MDQWDHKSNGIVTPNTVQAGSAYTATWRCGICCKECGKPHVWQAKVGQRTKASGGKCPACSGRKVCSCQSLATLRPDLMLEWADTNFLDPQTLGCFSSQKALWTCSKIPEHGSWSATIGCRTKPHASGCPTCGIEALYGPRNMRGLLKDEFPEVYAQLLPVPWRLNFLERLTSGSHQKVWWRCTETQNRPPNCPHEHIWQAPVKRRCLQASGCPFCSGLCVCPCDSIAEKVQGMLEFWHFDRNMEVSPEQVGTYSQRKVWWRHSCPTTGEEHEWQANVSAFHKTYMQDDRLRRGEYRNAYPARSAGNSPGTSPSSVVQRIQSLLLPVACNTAA